MDWPSLASTGLGGLLAIVGGLAAQMLAERKARARETREREHEGEVWARTLRFQAHVAFLSEFDQNYQLVSGVSDGSDPPDDFLTSLWDRLQSVRLVCKPATAEAGERAFHALFKFTFQSGLGDDAYEQVDRDRESYLAAVRDEFGLPPVPAVSDSGPPMIVPNSG